MAPRNTSAMLLDSAQSLVQERGFNAFSFKDLAEDVGIRTASIHYHFETKAQLGQRLMERYLEELEEFLADAETGRTAKSRLRAFIEMYREAERDGVVCLCGSLASDIQTLPSEIRRLVETYVKRSETWVAERIAEGTDSSEFDPIASPQDLGALLVSGLQGALLLGRACTGNPMRARVERSFWKALGG